MDILLRCNFSFWQNYGNGKTNDSYPIIHIAHNFYDPESPNFGFLTNIGVAIVRHNSCSPYKVELKHEIKAVMQDPKLVAKDNLNILKNLVEDNSNDVDNSVNVLQALDNLQKSLEEQDIDWGRFIFNTSMVDICTNGSAKKVINAWKQNKTSLYVKSFVKKYLNTLFTYVIGDVLYILNEYWNDKYSEYESSVTFLLDEESEVNTSEYYYIPEDVSKGGDPILIRILR